LLKTDLNAANGYTVLLTELKAAAVDVATKQALKEGTRVVYCDNIPTLLHTSPEALSKYLIHLAKELITLSPKSLDDVRNE